jgi:hypothetical protein
MSAIKSTTGGPRWVPCLAPIRGTERAADADAFAAWLGARPDDAPHDLTPDAGASAPLAEAALSPRLSPSDALTLRVINGPLAGLILRAHTEYGRLVVHLEATDAALRARAMQARAQLEAELAARFEQPITLEWPDAPDPC